MTYRYTQLTSALAPLLAPVRPIQVFTRLRAPSALEDGGAAVSSEVDGIVRRLASLGDVHVVGASPSLKDDVKGMDEGSTGTYFYWVNVRIFAIGPGGLTAAVSAEASEVVYCDLDAIKEALNS